MIVCLRLVQPSQNSVWETALIKVGSLGAETLISADLCRVTWVITVGMSTFPHINQLRDNLYLSACNQRGSSSD